MASLYTTNSTFQKFYVLRTECIYVFVWISEPTDIISRYIINQLVFMTETNMFTARYELNL